jgi:hypothetical protein
LIDLDERMCDPAENITAVLAGFGVNRVKPADKALIINLYKIEDEEAEMENLPAQVCVFNGDTNSPWERMDVKAVTTVKDVITKAKIHFKCDFQEAYTLYSTNTGIFLEMDSLLLPIFEDAKKNQVELVTILKKVDAPNTEIALEITKNEKRNSYKKAVWDKNKATIIKPKRWSSLQQDLNITTSPPISPIMSPPMGPNPIIEIKAKVPNSTPSNPPLEFGKRKSSLKIDSIPKFSTLNKPSQGPNILKAGGSLTDIQSQLSDFINKKEQKEPISDFEKMLSNLDSNIKKTQNPNVFNSLEKELEHIIESQLDVATDNRRKSRLSIRKDDLDSDLLFDDLKVIGNQMAKIENVIFC